MIENYVKKLIENIPPTNKTENIDLILDGGVFNGSYQIGSLYFLKEMENQKMIKICKISGSSVGALCALLYFINRLDLASKFYGSVIKHFKKYKKLDFLHYFIDNDLKSLLPDDIHKRLSGRLYICYYNVKSQKKIIRKKYKCTDDLLNAIKRSAFIPFFINGKMVYENRYMDGANPYIFKCEPNKKILYIDLFGYDKLTHLFSIKNEKTNFHRILTGVLDAHLFFIKKTSTQMCSYVNDWSIYSWARNRVVKYFFEKIIFYAMVLYIRLKAFMSIPEWLKETLAAKIIGEVYALLVEHYCL